MLLRSTCPIWNWDRVWLHISGMFHQSFLWSIDIQVFCLLRDSVAILEQVLRNFKVKQLSPTFYLSSKKFQHERVNTTLCLWSASKAQLTAIKILWVFVLLWLQFSVALWFCCHKGIKTFSANKDYRTIVKTQRRIEYSVKVVWDHSFSTYPKFSEK